ncbi:MAG: methylmalonyl Co-A mutase-associated GTPase MeaB [Candidatus Eisenbacteria bacterium]|nr:methylmalonyl Co-A mutase-associated GTPase MeaB [Candidatus Eisenbacteria bacterium]
MTRDETNHNDPEREEPKPTLQVRKGVEPPPPPLRTGAKRAPLSTEEYVEGVLSGDRNRLARAITLVESNAPADFARARGVLQSLLPRAGRSIRVGVTGVPGAGKSTFIETVGMELAGRGHRVAVTAVDPSSSVSGGSILGDKTRMEHLANHPGAFIRPSPSGGTLGGVTRKTRETVILFEAAGYDVILIETVGVGQNEIVVRSMVDFFLLLLIPGAGDELQGMKKGIMEIADAVLVNKADGGNRDAAERARSEYEKALHYLRPATEGWTTKAFAASALTGEGVEGIWRTIERFVEITRDSGAFERRRRAQEREWMHALVRDRLRDLFLLHPEVRRRLPQLEKEVTEGRLPATTAAGELLELFECSPKREETPE